MTEESDSASFWEHLDALRTVIIKMVAVWVVFSVAAFIFKEPLFDFVLAPGSSDFFLYRLLGQACARWGLDPPAPVHVELINTGLAQQFLIHVRTALCAGLVLAAPYALYLLFGFISPGLYSNERRYASATVCAGYLMFLVGLALSYSIIFPLTFQFLGSYQVSAEVTNMITLESYMATLITMSLCMGAVCELPVVAWLTAKAGLLKAAYMTRYRRHAIVVILVVAAIITPTSDVFTLLVVSLPIWLLYETSVIIVKRTERDK